MLLQAVVIILLLLLIAIAAGVVVWYFYQAGRLPRRWRRRIRHWGRRLRRKKTTIAKYAETIGYSYDQNVDKIIKKAKRRERKRKGADATNAFLLASLYNYNVAPNASTAAGRLGAQQQAATYMATAVNRLTTGPLPTAPQGDDNQLPPDFIIDRAEAFYDDYIRDIMAVNPAAVADVIVARPDFEAARARVRAARVVPPGAPKSVAQEIFFEDREVVADPQNVHDSQVNADMRRTFDSLRSRNAGLPTADLHALGARLQAHRWTDPAARDRALQTYTTMLGRAQITSLDSTEDQVLGEVWRRIQSPENEQNRTTLEESLFDSLADAMDRAPDGQYRQVCTTGRCARVIGSLTLLDKDPALAAPMKTTEILRNEIFSKSYQLIQHRLAEADPTVRAIYEDGAAGTPEQETAARTFEQSLRDTIETTIRADYPDAKPETLDSIIRDAQAGV